jgi:uncharacterized SAM-binding protein YcdF (DUF218 family)
VFLTLSKILDVLFLGPLSWALWLLLLSLLLRRRRATPWLVGAAVVVLYAFSLDPVAQALLRYAESGARSTYRPDRVYDAVVVLGGYTDLGPTRRRGALDFDERVDRLLTGWELVRDGHARFVLLSGGNLDARPGDVAEAEWAGAKLRSWGVPADRIVEEPRSRNTHENALESARIVRERGWGSLLLDTSAFHMPRALATFRAAGLAPDTLPVDWKGDDARGMHWLPVAGALRRSTDALRELAGRAVYRWMGYAEG